MRRIVLALALWLAAAAAMANQAAEQVEAAVAQIDAAAQLLGETQGSESQVIALAQAVTAYEQGLAALRDGARAAALRKSELDASLLARQADLSRLLATLGTMQSQPAPVVFLHPGGALDAVHAAQAMTVATQALNRSADELRSDAGELARLQDLQQSAIADLRAGLAGLTAARAALEDAIARGDPVPERFVEDRMQVQILAATSDTMQAFAAALTDLPLPPSGQESRPLAPDARLPLPVAGGLRYGYDTPDATGRNRPGIVIEAAPLSLVSAPFDATVRFAGSFLDFGEVVILEPENGTLLTIAGLGRLFRAEGDVLAAGEPLGLLGGDIAGDEEFLIDAAADSASQVMQTVYIELRRNGQSVDPTPWFNLDEAIAVE